MLFSNLCLTFIYNFPSFHALITSKEDYPFVDPDRCVAPPLLTEKGSKGSKIISFDLNVA